MTRLLVFVLFFGSFPVAGQVRLGRLFSDHAVLQRRQPLPVWGWAKPGETVRVVLAGQGQTAKADATGKWMVTFGPMEAGGPHTLAVTAQSGQAGASDLLVGEVWLCSGQSNMEWPVKQADHFPAERQNANFPQIRHFNVAHELALTEQTELPTGDWRVCSSETVGDFTAVGFFFARELTRKLDGVPVGLVHSSWGGSQVEGWLSKAAMLSNDELRGPGQRLPTTWPAADSLVDLRLRKTFLSTKNNFPTPADEARYHEPNYDFSRWQKVDPLGEWTWKGFNSFRGRGYMSRQIDVPADMAAGPTTLGLAENDSQNKVYINEKLVSDGILTGLRKISLPAGTWQAGPNRIVVKLGGMSSPAWFGLGLRGTAADLFLDSPAGHIGLASDWQIMPAFAEPHSYTKFVNNVATSIYNAMIKPLIPFSVRGLLWYQGENNAGRAYQYRQSFPLLIADWRRQWGQDFSAYFVQLSSYGSSQSSNAGSNWAELREAQTMTLRLPKTGMAVTTDIGNAADIHPTNKQDVAHRLVLNALHTDFGQPGPYSSPMFDSLTVTGATAIVSFKHATDGLMATDKYGYLRGFEMAGEDHVFHYARAEINGNRVMLTNSAVPRPIAVRYAWTDAPTEANLFSTNGLPVCPFRTDTWPGVTVNAKFD